MVLARFFLAASTPGDHLLWVVHDFVVVEVPVKVEGGRVMPWFTKKI
jgi:hypothetical protein